jgi:aldehyde dehydrogenase (NAD+)
MVDAISSAPEDAGPRAPKDAKPRAPKDARPQAPESLWEYAPAPESREIVSIAADYGLFIDGEFTPAEDGKRFTTVNPATEEPLADVADAGAHDADRAVGAARTAVERTWGPMPGRDRAKYL